MKITPDRTVGDIAAFFPEVVTIFESKKIDYCCGGNQTLRAACEAKNLDADVFMQDIETVIGAAPDRAHNWTHAPLSELIGHIVGEYHERCRAESMRLETLFEKVVARHGGEHPELMEAQRLFSVLSKELSTHMLEEEQTLFRYIEQLERVNSGRQASMPHVFISATATIREMLENHDEAGVLSREIREVTAGYTVPSDACNSYRALLYGLDKFEHNLHLHVHLENNILFPRACDLENAGELPPELMKAAKSLPIN